MQLSRTALTIGESATLKLNAQAQALRASGEPVIHLGGGEPVTLAPPSAVAAAEALLDTGAVRYTPPEGTPALRKAIAAYTETFHGRATRPDEVIASAGAKQAIQICLQAVVDPGDEVLIVAPYWVSYPEMVRIAGGVPVVVAPKAGELLPSASAVVDRITQRTRAVILNSPSNPSGLCLPDDVVEAIVQACARRGAFLVSDDIYHRLVFDGRRPDSCYRFAGAEGPDHIVLVNSASKQYAMTGFRIGWAVAARPLIEAMTNLQSHETSGPSTLGQAAAVAALSGPQDAVEDLRLALEARRDALVRELAPLRGVRLTKPHGTFYCFPDFREYDADSVRLAAFLLEKARVVTVPGIEFGCEGHLRLSFCASTGEVLEGARRIRWALDPSSPRELALGSRTVVRDW